MHPYQSLKILISQCKAWGLLGNVLVPLQGMCWWWQGWVPQHLFAPASPDPLHPHHGIHAPCTPLRTAPCCWSSSLPLATTNTWCFSIKRHRAPEDCSVLEHYKYICEDSSFCLTPDTLWYCVGVSVDGYTLPAVFVCLLPWRNFE